MANIRMSSHAKVRCMERIEECDVVDFLRGVKNAIIDNRIGGQTWSVRVDRDRKTLGYAAGERSVWVTTLSSGMNPRGRQLVVIKL